MKKQKIGLFFGDGLIGHEALNKLFPDIMNLGYEIVLFPTGKSNSKKGSLPELAYTGFYETTLLNDVVMPFLDKNKPLLNPDNSPIKGMQYSLKQLIRLYDLECRYVPDVNDPKFLDDITNDDQIIGAISIRNYKIFKQETINLFKSKGFLWNLHTGILPHYKGVYIPYRSITNNDDEYGWTLHKIDASIDTGEILAIGKCPLDIEAPVLNSYLSITQKGADIIIAGLKHYSRQGSYNGKKQSAEEKLSYYTFPTAEEMMAWKNQNIRFVNITEVPSLYANRFSIEGTRHEETLRNNIIQAIAEYERFGTMEVQKDIRKQIAKAS